MQKKISLWQILILLAGLLSFAFSQPAETLAQTQTHCDMYLAIGCQCDWGYQCFEHGADNSCSAGEEQASPYDCPPPTPAPTPPPTPAPPPVPSFSTPSCINTGDNGSAITISWSAVTPNVSRVDVSTDSSFGSFQNKSITGGQTSTNASGFSTGQAYNPSTSYYVRLYNGRYSTETGQAWFQVMPCSSANQPACLVSSVYTPGTSARFNYFGNFGNPINAWVEKRDGSSIGSTTPARTGSYTDSGGFTYNKFSECNGSSSCSNQVSISNLSPGNYWVHCDANAGNEQNRCSGNPRCNYEGGTLDCGSGWRSCSGSDWATFTIVAPTPPPQIVSCNQPCNNTTLLCDRGLSCMNIQGTNLCRDYRYPLQSSCTAPVVPNPPTVSPLSCVNTPTYSVNISWNSPNVSWVDLSTSWPYPWNSYSHKYVAGSSASTVAPSGFKPYLGIGVATLNAGTTYYTRVYNNSRNSSWVAFRRDHLLPGPTHLAAIPASPADRYTFSWDNVAGAQKYYFRVQDITGINPLRAFTDDNVTTNSTTHFLIPGHRYQWWVHAVNSCGLSPAAYGYVNPPLQTQQYTIDGYLYEDVNRNNLYDDVHNVALSNNRTIELHNQSSLVATVATGSNRGTPGYYLIDKVPPGTYTVRAPVIAGYTYRGGQSTSVTISSANQSVHFPLVAPQPTPVVQTPSCLTPDYTGNGITVSWTGGDPRGTWVEISDNTSFTGNSGNKYVPPGQTSTTAQGGFSQTLSPLQPNTPYYARLLDNDLQNPGSALSFSIPRCIPPNRPTVSPLSCTPTQTYSVNIIWTDNNITFVDLSSSNDPDNNYSNKEIVNPANTRATSAPGGFTARTGTGVTTLEAGVSYSTRVFNGFLNNERWVPFSRRLCPPTSPWLQTTGGDVHSNTNISLPLPP